MPSLREAICSAGGALAVAGKCGVSVRAVYKWMAAGVLPRTEYTGETNYAEVIAKAAAGDFTAQELLERSSPARKSNVRQPLVL